MQNYMHLFRVYYPLDVTTDSSGNVYVMEYYNNRIKVFDSSGAYLRSFGRLRLWM